MMRYSDADGFGLEQIACVGVRRDAAPSRESTINSPYCRVNGWMHMRLKSLWTTSEDA